MLVFTVSCANSRICTPCPRHLRPSYMRMRVLTLVGNRPQFVKAAAVSAHAARAPRRGARALAASTTTTSCRRCSSASWRCRRPTASWASAPAPPSEQVAGMMHALEPVLDDVQPGPGARLRRHQHDARGRALVRAARACRSRTSSPGCARSTDSMPEERNRVLTDHLSELLLCSTPTRGREPRARGRRRRRRAGRRRDGRRDASMTAPVAARESDALARFGGASRASTCS